MAPAGKSALPAALDALLVVDDVALEKEADDAALDAGVDVALELDPTGLPHFTPFAHIVHESEYTFPSYPR